jgi:hypothetical protein
MAFPGHLSTLTDTTMQRVASSVVNMNIITHIKYLNVMKLTSHNKTQQKSTENAAKM